MSAARVASPVSVERLSYSAVSVSGRRTMCGRDGSAVSSGKRDDGWWQ